MRAPGLNSLLARLLLAYLVPTLVLFAAFGTLVHRFAAKSLEESLGRRLVGIAQAAAVQIIPETVLFLSPGDDQSRTAQRLRHKLNQIAQRTQVARIYILDRDRRSKADTTAKARIGDLHYHAEADRLELDRVFAGRPSSSVLFKGTDGRIYKTGYAPVFDGDRVVAALGVEGSAQFFASLAQLRRTLILSGAVVAVLVILISVILARRITHPLRSLAREASRIGGGKLDRPIPVISRDEVGLLAATMNEMREDLFHRDQQTQMMLGGIAHEVRNPLGGIELFAGLLREELEGDDERLMHVKRIERELSYLKQVVNDFLAFARRSPPALLPADLSDIALQMLEVVGGDAQAREVTLTLTADHAAPVACDEGQLRQALLNLLRNAVQASPTGAAVRVRVQASDTHVACLIEDRGAGIDPELVGRIFEPFFTTREKGTGLGLALAKKIVEDHQGTLTVSSVPGQGSTFTLQLPQKRTHGDSPDHR